MPTQYSPIRKRLYHWTEPAELFWRRVDRSGVCWLWQGGTTNGYGRFTIHKPTYRVVFAHRFSYELAHGPIPDGLYVCHNCPDGDNPLCVNPAHLFLGTALDNNRDAQAKGHRPAGDRHHFRRHPELAARGERVAGAKLTAAIVRECRQRYATGGATYASLAAEFGVSTVAIRKLVARQTWRHIIP